MMKIIWISYAERQNSFIGIILIWIGNFYFFFIWLSVLDMCKVHIDKFPLQNQKMKSFINYKNSLIQKWNIRNDTFNNLDLKQKQFGFLS